MSINLTRVAVAILAVANVAFAGWAWSQSAPDGKAAKASLESGREALRPLGREEVQAYEQMGKSVEPCMVLAPLSAEGEGQALAALAGSRATAFQGPEGAREVRFGPWLKKDAQELGAIAKSWGAAGVAACSQEAREQWRKSQ